MPPKPFKLIPADLKVVELRKELSARGLPTKGLKKDLIVRLEEALGLDNKEEDQEVEIEDKSSAEPPSDLGTQQQLSPENPPDNGSNKKSQDEVVSELLNEPTSPPTQVTSNNLGKSQDRSSPQISEPENGLIADQASETTEEQKEFPLHGSAVETDGKTLESEVNLPLLDTPSTSQVSNQVSMEASLPTQIPLHPLENSVFDAYADSTTAQNISENSNPVNISLTSEILAPQCDSLPTTVLTSYTKTAYPNSNLTQDVSESALQNPNLVNFSLTPGISAPVSDILPCHIPTTYAEIPPIEQEVQIQPTLVESWPNNDLDPQTQASGFSTIQVSEALSAAPLGQDDLVADLTQNQEFQANLNPNEQVRTTTSETFATTEYPIKITVDHQATSEIVPNKDISQTAIDDRMDSSESSSQVPPTSNVPMETCDHSDEVHLDANVTKPDEKSPCIEANYNGLHASPSNNNRVEKPFGFAGPSHIENHSPCSTASQPQPLNTHSSHEMSPRVKEEAVSYQSSSPMDQGEKGFSLDTDCKPLKFVAITNLTRPFPLSDFEEQLREYGAMDVFWIDKFRSHCYVQYENSAGAIQCQSMLAGVQFPPKTGKKLDVVLLDEAEGQLLLEQEKASSERYILSIEENKPQLTLYSESHRASVRSAPPTRHASLKEQDSPKLNSPGVQPDEHFCKTSTQPPLYYKPTKDLDLSSSDGVAEKRSREDSNSDEAPYEFNSGSPIRKQARTD